MVDINIKGYPEQDNVAVFVLEFIIHFFGALAGSQLCIFSLTFFIIFSSYVIAQLQLVALYVRNVPLNDSKLLRRHLQEIVFLHLDVLG